MAGTSSAKNPGYSRRRESIEDHLSEARNRGDSLGIKWTKKLVSRSFVEDLVKRRIIGGPRHEGAKIEGPGVKSRFLPRDYRHLLEVIRLKSLGTTHRKSWLVHLWLRGRDYDLERVREALAFDLQRIVSNVMAQFSPTGRRTGSFDRRFRRLIPTKSKHDQVLKILTALALRPSELQNIVIDVDHIASVIAEGSELSATDLAGLIRRSLKLGASGQQELYPELNQRWLEIAERFPGAKSYMEHMLKNPQQFSGMANRMHGTIDDGFGSSGLVRAARECTDEQLLRARRWHQMIRFNRTSMLRRDVDAIHDSEQRAVLDFLFENDKIMRKCIQAGADDSVFVFGMILNDEVPAATPNWSKKQLDTNKLLETMRDDFKRS